MAHCFLLFPLSKSSLIYLLFTILAMLLHLTLWILLALSVSYSTLHITHVGRWTPKEQLRGCVQTAPHLHISSQMEAREHQNTPYTDRSNRLWTGNLTTVQQPFLWLELHILTDQPFQIRKSGLEVSKNLRRYTTEYGADNTQHPNTPVIFIGDTKHLCSLVRWWLRPLAISRLSQPLSSR